MSIKDGPKITTDGLTLALDAGNRFSYPGSGTAWKDLSGNGNNATLINGASFNSEYGGSITFDGVNDYVSLGSAVNTNSAFTLEFWAMRTPGTYSTLFSGTPASGYLQIRLAEASVSLVKSYVAELGNFGTSTGTPVNTLVHLVLTRSGTTYTAYINGDFKNTLTISQTFTTSNVAFGINTWNSEPFSGRVYKFSYYNRPLTQTEITQNFNATKTRFGL